MTVDTTLHFKIILQVSLYAILFLVWLNSLTLIMENYAVENDSKHLFKAAFLGLLLPRNYLLIELNMCLYHLIT